MVFADGAQARLAAGVSLGATGAVGCAGRRKSDRAPADGAGAAVLARALRQIRSAGAGRDGRARGWLKAADCSGKMAICPLAGEFTVSAEVLFRDALDK